DFGSGAVKITPAHDFNDFETGKRNNLPMITILGKDACINENAPEKYRGLDRYDARKAMLADLDALGLLIKTEPYKFSPGRSYRSNQIVEPLSIGKQWFVSMTPLAEPAIEAVRDGRIEFIPKSWDKTYFNWMENIRDWCISRQLWWGHRIPAWDCADCGQTTVSREDASACSSCGSANIVQDSDVLDTWFSSGLWPFSTLGWPDDTESLKKFYPTTVMETGFDIIFFWVARMIFFGLHFMDEVPFKTVFLHAMVRDKAGQKMSKSKGNVIDPLHLIDGMRPEDVPADESAQYAMLLEDFPDGIAPQGADALRFTLAIYAAAGRDIKLDVRRVEGYRAFVNKVWNATRFALMNLEDYEAKPFSLDGLTLSPADEWLLARLKRCAASVQEDLEAFKFSDAAQTLYEFVWHEFCDWYLELAKPLMYGDETSIPGNRESTQAVLVFAMDQFLRLLHPFMPFITEEVWSALPKPADSAPALVVAEWPDASTIPTAGEGIAMQQGIGVITGIRRVRGESNLPPGARLPLVILYSDDPEQRASLESMEGYLKKLAKVDGLQTQPTSAERPSPAATAMIDGIEICIPLEGLIDFDAERARIRKQIGKAELDIGKFEKKLANPKFVASAPPEVIAKDQGKLDAAREKKAALEAGLERMQG
ncbi:MAG: valyl-tRNA synthetase, partial [Bradymonadia bacterium]